MDPQSLLILSDEIIVDILFFIPLKSQVRLSRTSKRMSRLVDRQMLTVRRIRYDDLWQEEDESAGLYVLPKMTGLQVFHAPCLTDVDICEKVAEVLAENCPDIRDMDAHPDIILTYVNRMRMRSTKCEIRLRNMHLSSGWYSSELIDLLRSCPQLLISCYDFSQLIAALNEDNEDQPLNTQDEMLIRSRVVKYTSHEEPPFEGPELQMMENLTTLWLRYCTCDRNQLSLILSSCPRLTDLHIASELENFDLLNSAPHVWKRVRVDDRSDVQGIVDTTNMCDFLKSRGRQLDELKLLIRKHRTLDVDLISLIGEHCGRKKLVKASITVSQDFAFIYYNKSLLIQYCCRESIAPLIHLFPSTRSFVIHTTRKNPHVNTWIQELEQFAASKSCRRVTKAEVRISLFANGSSVRTLSENNLDLTVVNISSRSRKESEERWPLLMRQLCISDPFRE